MADLEYRRLTRAKSRSHFGIVSTSRSSLWLGRDHLLQIDTSGYTETYKRFHFRDIQALVLCKTDVWLYRSIAFGVLVSLFALVAIFGGGPILAWVFGILASLFALFLVLDVTAGPTAKCYLRTAVQTEPLVSLVRLRRARTVFETLRPLVTAAQAEPMPHQPASEFGAQPTPPVISDVALPLSAPVAEVSGPEPRE
jgi:hypothetical protein